VIKVGIEFRAFLAVDHSSSPPEDDPGVPLLADTGSKGHVPLAFSELELLVVHLGPRRSATSFERIGFSATARARAAPAPQRRARACC
jgi:hypothetical protein